MRKDQAFFAMTDRCRFIQRWSLMRNMQDENVAEHSFQTAVIAHGLAVIRKTRFPELLPVIDPRDALTAALYHDVTEVITGDLPTPVKYHDPELEKAYKRIERLAAEDILAMLPEEMRPYYAPYIGEVDEDASEEAKALAALVKAADKLSAYVKCQAEIAQGNGEFKEAMESTLARLYEMKDPVVETFLMEFAPAFALSLDRLRRGPELRVVK